MRHLRRWWAIPVLVLVGLVSYTPSREVIAQAVPPFLAYGNNSGTLRPVSVGSSGEVLIDDDALVAAVQAVEAGTDNLANLGQACDSTAAVSISTTANNEIVPLAAGEVQARSTPSTTLAT